MRLAEKKMIGSKSDEVFYILNMILMVIIAVVLLYPLWFVLIASVSDYRAVGRGEVIFWPKGFYLEAYEKLFQRKSILLGYRNTLFYTIVGTAINIILTITGGYALSVKFPGRRIISFLITFTMFFGGGIIPTYFTYRNLGLLNTVWIMLLPGAVSAYYLILARTFITSNIPEELYEASSIDGCDRFKFYIKVVIPLSTVLISMMTLFYAVGHWNSYFNAMMFLDDSKLYPLQLVAREILILNSFDLDDIIDPEVASRSEQLKEQLQYALIIVVSLPMLVLYPFLQKYFVKGIMIGSIKG